MPKRVRWADKLEGRHQQRKYQHAVLARQKTLEEKLNLRMQTAVAQNNSTLVKKLQKEAQNMGIQVTAPSPNSLK